MSEEKHHVKTEENFDASAFRRALGCFATGVAVITARGPSDEAIGLTMSSFNTVSLSPPLILFSLDRRAKSIDAMLAARGYAVNILSRDQEQLSNQFAKALSDKWTNVQHTLGIAEAPLIEGALAHFECIPYAHYDGGDHIIFVGEVLNFTARDANAEPLLFYGGRYCRIAQEDQHVPEWPLPIHYW